MDMAILPAILLVSWKPPLGTMRMLLLQTPEAFVAFLFSANDLYPEALTPWGEAEIPIWLASHFPESPLYEDQRLPEALPDPLLRSVQKETLSGRRIITFLARDRAGLVCQQKPVWDRPWAKKEVNALTTVAGPGVITIFCTPLNFS
jgi:hypothetical protein